MAGVMRTITKIARLRFGRPIVTQANVHRDRAEWIEAVVGYRRGLEWLPWREDLKIQIGNCLKEYGDYRGAMRAYGTVTGGMHRPEALKQMAETNRRATGTILPYQTAKSGDMFDRPPPAPLPELTAAMLPNRLEVEAVEPRRWLGPLGRTDHVATRWKGNNYPSITLDQVGSMAMVRDGALEPLLAGVVAVRARIFSLSRVETAEIWLGEGDAAVMIASVPAQAVDRGVMPIRLAVVNAWIDCERLPPGPHWLSVRCGRKTPPTGLFVTIAPAGHMAADLASSDAFVTVPAGADPDAAIPAAPAQARSAARALFDKPIRNILALRVDQLGDVSASLAAMARLRALYPDAMLTIVVQPPVRAVVEASGIADRVLTLELGYDEASERRFLAQAEEARVRAMLAGERYDLAIDLCPGDETRPLLLLTGATYLVGYNADRFTFLDFGIGLRSRDKVNQLEKLSHGAAVMALVEALTVAVRPQQPAVPRVAASAAALARHDLAAGRYVVLHTGARHAINRWPAEHFRALARRLAAETDLAVVMFADPADAPAEAGPSGRIRLMGMIDPDTFDAIVSNARVLVGNDSGPKHLAAARGVATVSIHVDRLNWNEWGQSGPGTILSKRVPCTGCGLNDIRLCGREAVCIRSIGLDEVYRAVHAHL